MYILAAVAACTQAITLQDNEFQLDASLALPITVHLGDVVFKQHIDEAAQNATQLIWLFNLFVTFMSHLLPLAWLRNSFQTNLLR